MRRIVPATILALLLACGALAGPHGPAGWARGDLHQHTRYSDDANWEPAELWQRVRQVAPVGPRFVVMSDHNDIAGFFPNPTRPPSGDNWRSWEAVRELRKTLDGDELLLAGQELGGLRGGHMGAVLIPQTAGQAPPPLVTRKGFRHREWMQRVRAAGGLNVVYHPRGVQELGPIHPGTFTKWEECAELIDAVSVWNGYKLYDEPDAVAWEWLWSHWLAGRDYTAVGGSDSHKKEKKGEAIPYWGKEYGIGFEAHPMNPHNRVRVGETFDEDVLREGLRTGAVTVADWSENWIELELVVTSGEETRRVGVGQEGTAPSGSRVKVRIRGYGAPQVYSGEPRILLDFGRLGAGVTRLHRVPADEDTMVEVPLRRRTTLEIPVSKGDFSEEVELPLSEGVWLVAARVVPDNPIGEYWRGVQITNPARLTVLP